MEKTTVTIDQLLGRIRPAVFSCDSGLEVQNYSVTDYRCHYVSENHSVDVEEVCINEYGSCYGTNLKAIIRLADEETVDFGYFGWIDIPAC